MLNTVLEILHDWLTENTIILDHFKFSISDKLVPKLKAVSVDLVFLLKICYLVKSFEFFLC